jgi:hypothetical protein
MLISEPTKVPELCSSGGNLKPTGIAVSPVAAQDEGVIGNISLNCVDSRPNIVSSSPIGSFNVGFAKYAGTLSLVLEVLILHWLAFLLDLAPYTHSSPALWQRLHRVNEVLSPKHRSFCWWHLSHDFRNVRPSARRTTATSVLSGSVALADPLSRVLCEDIRFTAKAGGGTA